MEVLIMKFCTHCGKQLEDDFQFCNGCGAPVANGNPVPPTQNYANPVPPVQDNPNQGYYNANPYGYANPEPVTISEDYSIAQEKEQLDFMYKFLKFERIAWKVGGIVITVLAGLFAFLGLIFLIVSADSYGYREDFYLSMGLTYFFMGILYVPIGIVGFKMVGKVEEYMNMLYYDAAPVVQRCTSVGMIVLGAFFNTIAMVFIIVNFAKTKSNLPTFQRAIDRQRNINK